MNTQKIGYTIIKRKGAVMCRKTKCFVTTNQPN